MYIGEIARKTGASIKAIRFYEEVGLLTGVSRSGRYRVYSDTHVLLVNLILEAKNQGFKLSELKHVVSGDNVQEPWLKILELIEQKQQSLTQEIERKQAQRKALAEYHAQIQRCLADSPQCQLKDRA